jgi:hypothetical protein
MEEDKKEDIATEQASADKTVNEEITITSEPETVLIDSVKKKSKPINKKFVAILIIAVIAILAYSGYTNGKFDKQLGIQPPMTVAEATKFINDNLMSEGATANVSEVTEENGLWKIKLTVSDQEYTTYLTKDKGTFFPQALSIAEIQQQKADAAKQAADKHTQELASLTKNDKPTVELFVMSHCPYGTQAEKGIIPVIEALGNKIDFRLKFCDYSMHDEKELKEEMNQYCIMQNQGDKFISYLKCFLTDGDGGKCLTQVGIDTNSLNTCVAATDTKYKILANYADKTTWKNGTYPLFPVYQADVDKYKVSGSPTLVINGATIESDRDSASLLKTVCSGFTTAPAECGQTLSSTAPSSGFGYAEGTNTNASCG